MSLAHRLASLSLVLATLGAQAAPIDLPDIPQCTELLPGAVAPSSEPVTPALHVVLDGVTQQQAAPLVAAAQGSYTPLGITLRVTYQSIGYASSDGLELLDEVKRSFGGSRPAGTHLVYVLTAKNLTDSLLGDSLAGQADCIGGVAYAGNAFAVGEYDTDVGAKTMAHELGHLFGGQHHYANCAEALLQGGDNLCTLMFNDVGLAAFPFSTLNGLVVQGHAQAAAGGSGSTDTPPATDNGNAGGSGGGSGGSLGWLGLAAFAALRACRRLTSSQRM